MMNVRSNLKVTYHMLHHSTHRFSYCYSYYCYCYCYYYYYYYFWLLFNWPLTPGSARLHKGLRKKSLWGLLVQ